MPGTTKLRGITQNTTFNPTSQVDLEKWFFSLVFNGYKTVPEPQEAKVVGLIFDAYLTGSSHDGLIDQLYEKGIASHSGQEKWSTAMLYKILNDPRYIPLIGFEKYVSAQFELDRRSKIDIDTGKRKTTRYHSKIVLSGPFVCAECGRRYRRVQRVSGEMVWRCASRVEYGSRICKSSPTITEEEAIRFVRETLGISELDTQAVHEGIETITVQSDGSLSVNLKPTLPSMEAGLWKTMQ